MHTDTRKARGTRRGVAEDATAAVAPSDAMIMSTPDAYLQALIEGTVTQPGDRPIDR
jgi:hypothetical protein